MSRRKAIASKRRSQKARIIARIDFDMVVVRLLAEHLAAYYYARMRLQAGKAKLTGISAEP